MLIKKKKSSLYDLIKTTVQPLGETHNKRKKGRKIAKAHVQRQQRIESRLRFPTVTLTCHTYAPLRWYQWTSSYQPHQMSPCQFLSKSAIRNVHNSSVLTSFASLGRSSNLWYLYYTFLLFLFFSPFLPCTFYTFSDIFLSFLLSFQSTLTLKHDPVPISQFERLAQAQ
jgi:hypothetical protein